MKITNIKSQWSEKQGFYVDRPDTGNEYIFLHFLSPAVLHGSYCDIAIQPGACIFYDKHVRLHFSSPDNPSIHDWFHLQGDLTELAEKYDLCFNQVYYPTSSFTVTEIVRGMEREFLQPDAFSEDYYAVKINELLLTLARNTPRPTIRPLDAKTRALLEDVRKTVLDRYAEDWDTEDMAKLAKMSRSSFYDAYKQLFGTSPKQDLISCRIQHAKFMLLTQAYSVEEIAKSCGYTNTCHFIRQFKAQTGATPGKFICL